MAEGSKPYTMIADFVTGREVPNVGAEENRQAVEKLLVAEKGYLKEDIKVDVDIAITVAGQPYRFLRLFHQVLPEREELLDVNHQI